MKRKDLTKIWTVLGLIMFYLTIDIFLRTKGVYLNLSELIYSEWNQHNASIFGIFFGVPLFFVLLYLTKYFRKRLGGYTFLSSLPFAFGIETDLSDRLGRQFQIFFFVIFLAVPMISQIYFFISMINGTVYFTGGASFVSGIDHLLKPVPIHQIFSNDMFRYGTNTGISFIPFYQPWFFLIIEVLLVNYFVKAVFMKRKGCLSRENSLNKRF